MFKVIRRIGEKNRILWGNQYSRTAAKNVIGTRLASTSPLSLSPGGISVIKNAICNTTSSLSVPVRISVPVGISAMLTIYSKHEKRHCSDDGAVDSSVNTVLGGWALWKHIVLYFRAIYLSLLFAPTIALAPFAESSIRFREKWLHLVYATLEKAGPAFIAWGQWAATRPDLFPRDLCIKLSKLPTVAPEHSLAYTKNTIETTFGRKDSEIFDDFEEKPISSGSVIQVHRATLRFPYPGIEAEPIVVAVKVKHPSIRESLERDFVIMQWFAKIANFSSTLRWLKLDDSVQRVAGFMMSQVDLSKKAELLGRFGYNFCGFEGISFPKPLYPLVHPDVSVETFEEGETISHYIDADVKMGLGTKNDLVYRGTFAFIHMFLIDNFVQTGMHSRNILLRLQEGKPHIIFSDIGMTAELSASEKSSLAKLIQSVGTRDGRDAATFALSLSKKQTCPDPDAFVEDVEKSFTFWDSKEGGFVNPYECMQRLLEKVRVHRVHIDDNISTVMVTILALEDWQRKFYLQSEHKVMQTFHLFGPPPEPFPYILTQSRTERGERHFPSLTNSRYRA